MQYIYCWNSSFSKAHRALKGRGLRKEGRREQNIIIRSWIRPFSSSLLGYTHIHILCMKTAHCIDYLKWNYHIFASSYSKPCNIFFSRNLWPMIWWLRRFWFTSEGFLLFPLFRNKNEQSSSISTIMHPKWKRVCFWSFIWTWKGGCNRKLVQIKFVKSLFLGIWKHIQRGLSYSLRRWK